LKRLQTAVNSNVIARTTCSIIKMVGKYCQQKYSNFTRITIFKKRLYLILITIVVQQESRMIVQNVDVTLHHNTINF